MHCFGLCSAFLSPHGKEAQPCLCSGRACFFVGILGFDSLSQSHGGFLNTCVCFQNEMLSWGPDACPCVQGIQGSSLFPVNVARKITLLGKNFHLYQVVSSVPSALINHTNAEDYLGTLATRALKIHVRHNRGSA